MTTEAAVAEAEMGQDTGRVLAAVSARGIICPACRRGTTLRAPDPARTRPLGPDHAALECGSCGYVLAFNRAILTASCAKCALPAVEGHGTPAARCRPHTERP